jgi:uncharacterized membrane protein YcaP (DUF421 family)
VDFLNIFYRTIIIYIAVLAVIRLMGKREIGTLSPFDFVVAIIIAELAAIPMEGKVSLLEGLLPIGILALLEISLSYLSLKNPFARRLICGRHQLIIDDGRVVENEMRRARYNINDLLAQLREKGYPDPSQVQYAILETSGELSVVPKPEFRPVTPSDLRLETGDGKLVLPVIMDGQVIAGSLRTLKLDRDWLDRELRRQGYRGPGEVLLATADMTGKLFLSRKG